MDQSPAAAAQRLAFNKRALFLAVEAGDTETVADLLDGGVPIGVRNDVGMSLLHGAAQGGHVTTLRLLIRRGCDVNLTDGRGLTALHLAAAKGQTKAVRELIRKGASKSVVAILFGSPLHLAVFSGHMETVVAMLEEGCPIDTVDSDGATVLHWAAAGGHVELVRELVGRGCDVNAANANGCTPLHDAAGCGKTEAACELINLGATRSVVAGMCGAPLHQAAIGGHVETVVAMLGKGCPIDTVNSVGATVLHCAAQGGHVELVRELIGRGCNVNAMSANGCTPLHVAAGCGKTEAACELINLGATRSVNAGTLGTPLHEAVFRGHVETVVTMLEIGCPIDTVNSDGATVLHWAAAGGHVELVRELVGRGCDVNAANANGCTPLHDAAGCGKTEAACELINLGATRSVVAGMCGAPLHQAAIGGHVETVVAMLGKGCPIDTVNSDGATVLHWAAAGGHVELVRELVGRGCDVNAMSANGFTSLHVAAACGRTEAVHELIKLDATKSVVVHDVMPSRPQVCECGIIGTRNSFGQTPVMLAAYRGHVEVFKLLTSKGGSVSDRDTHSLSSFELCFVGGHASKLSQFCEACGIVSSGQELWGALATLINQDLVDARKVLCLCAFSGDSVFLEDQFIDLVASDACAMPAAVRLAKQVFEEGIPFLNQLSLPDESTLGPLHMCLLSLKCSEMYPSLCVMGHTSFITKLLSHPVLKETVHELFPNGLSPLDLARQFDLHDIATLIEGAGGRPGVWADVPKEIESLPPDLFIKAIVEYSEFEYKFINLGGETVERADYSRLVNKQCQVKVEYASFKAVAEGSEHGIALISDLPPEIEVRHPLVLPRLQEAYVLIKDIAEHCGKHGRDYIRRFFSSVLQQPLADSHPLVSAEQLSKDSILRQKPTLSKVTRLIVPQASTQNWKLVGLLLLEGIADCEATLSTISHQFSDDRNRFLETLSYWLKHGSSVTWKTLLDVLGHFETKHTVDELTDKIVSVLGGGHQVSVQVLCGVLSGGASAPLL